ncbi:MAG: redoxin domain-containing protein [Deltaproteobacteria bacterium]|nr:redoxin domain-containing protein [Deltaproteobacteria bacterium]
MPSFRFASVFLRPARGGTVWATVALALALVASCGSSTSDPFDDPDVTGRTANPDGVPYPTDHIGGAERTRSRPGDRIPNFTFQGYVNGDRSKLQTISLADYFDPERKRHRLLVVQFAATWCAYCSQELTETEKVKSELAAEGAVFLQILVSGAKLQQGPSLDESEQWHARHAMTYSLAIDVGARRVGGIGVDGSVMPWDARIDTRTMEILESSGGSPADVAKYVREGLDFVNKNPPAVY